MISDSSNSNDWFVCPLPKPEAKMRLVLFPYAGGGPAAFGKWPAGFPSRIETWIAHYPGRGSRHNESPINRIPILVERLSQAIRPLLDKSFVFFGHSLGALVMYELARYLRRNNLPQPRFLFVSACGAPHILNPHPVIHALPDTEFLGSLQKINGIPTEVLNRTDMMQFLLPTLRADFEAVESYHYTPDEASLNCQITAFGGMDDARVSREWLEGWALHTNSGFKSQYFPGDHFFINTAREMVIASIASELTSSNEKN